MKILVSWLREFVTIDVSVQELADAITAHGFEVSSVDPAPPRIATEEEDGILDLEITTNRPDCLSVIGVAREVSTIYGVPLNTQNQELPNQSQKLKTLKTDSPLTVTVEEHGLCSRYVASVAEVTIGPSPAWLAARLEACDIRPVNNVVDATNYLMLEFGHPMHAFDLACLNGSEIRIRKAISGETIRTLDGNTHKLETDMLVIADATQPQAIAGVMGGKDSEVTGVTRTVALESAYFLPHSVRRTNKTLGLSTDASYRFERGTDLTAPLTAMHRLHALLKKIGASNSPPQIIDTLSSKIDKTKITLRHERVKHILGIDIDKTFIVNTLSQLGFSVTTKSVDHQWDVTVPSFRVDVTREIDLIEEIGRHYGYERLPSTFPTLVSAPTPSTPWIETQRILRRILTGGGYSEAITYSFIERSVAETFASSEDSLVNLANPLSEKYSTLRPSLLPGLLDCLIRNRRREHHDLRLFEIGKIFQHGKGERTAIAITLTGAAHSKHWSSDSRNTDFFDIKGIINTICQTLKISPHYEPAEIPQLISRNAASIFEAKDKQKHNLIGYAGQLIPALAKTRGFPDTGGEIFVAEIVISDIAHSTQDHYSLQTSPIPRNPSMVRDLAVVVNEDLRADKLRATIREAATETLISINEFDRYSGKGVPKGHVSLAFRLTFQAAERTLTDLEIQETIKEIIQQLKTVHNAQLR